MKFRDLSAKLEELEKISSRIEITKILSSIFTDSEAKEIDKIVYLLLGKLAPSYKGIVFNLADKMVIQAIAKGFGQDPAKVASLYKQKGDLGVVAMELRQDKETKDTSLSVTDVYNLLLEAADESGEGSQDRRIEKLATLLSQNDPLSVKFITRIPLGKLRLGFSDLTILDALSWMETGGKSKRAAITKAYEVMPDAGLIARMVKENGVDQAVAKVKPVLGVPISPMLAQRLKDPAEMVEKMVEVAVEPKYDGLRVLIHFKRNGFVKAFTRNLNDVSSMFPELDTLEARTDAKELILDAEAVGLDETTKKLADFQTTMQRRRKHEIAEISNKIPLVFNIFDILYKDGESLIGEDYLKRREVLEKTINQNKTFTLTPYTITKDPEVISLKHKNYIKQGLEGVLVKKVSSGYVPGRTGHRWVKMKEEAGKEGKLSDTIDCVIMGFTTGQGKRTTFGVGQFLAGVLEGDRFKTITKVGTGLTDDQFKELKKRLNPLKVNLKPNNFDVHKDLTPDYWVAPEIVVELAGDDLTVSPKHTAGYALRFPRLVKFRDDKKAQQSTTVSEVKTMFKLQKST